MFKQRGYIELRIKPKEEHKPSKLPHIKIQTLNYIVPHHNDFDLLSIEKLFGDWLRSLPVL